LGKRYGSLEEKIRFSWVRDTVLLGKRYGSLEEEIRFSWVRDTVLPRKRYGSFLKRFLISLQQVDCYSKNRSNGKYGFMV